MIKETVLESNMQMYLQKMEEKFNQNAQKLNKLQQTIQNAAKLIQRRFRKFMLKKKTRTAIKIQRAFRKFMSRKRQKQAIMQRVRRLYATYKIYYFLKSIVTKNKSQISSKPTAVKTKSIVETSKKGHHSKLSMLTKVRLKSRKFIILLSSLQSQIAYIRKYMAYDRKKFTQSWQTHEKKQREWMWEQVRKKWVRKGGEIWINEQQKQVNAEKYVSAIIEQGYQKHFEKYEASQKRLQKNQQELRNRMVGLTKAFYFAIVAET